MMIASGIPTYSADTYNPDRSEKEGRDTKNRYRTEGSQAFKKRRKKEKMVKKSRRKNR